MDWSERVTRWIIHRRSWHSLIFPIIFASWTRTILNAVDATADLPVGLLCYGIAVGAGLLLAAALDRAGNHQLPRGVSAVLGSVGFTIAGFTSNRPAGAYFGVVVVGILVILLCIGHTLHSRAVNRMEKQSALTILERHQTTAETRRSMV